MIKAKSTRQERTADNMKNYGFFVGIMMMGGSSYSPLISVRKT